ncbi:AAA family ATPase [Pseudophaeobacter leonis]|uniref:AAA family ATPase n=1 Tax=Pseudophaeobacter leonis TaxID=1144477 RepID=UPI00137481B0|nr:AAA family ATPase [Pseudophaeobacter leonis]
MVKSLLDWAEEQEPWVGDSLRRIADTSDHAVIETDFKAICENVKAAAGIRGAVANVISLQSEHIYGIETDKPRTVLTQIGPVQNIDRLANDQKLRFSPSGITLIYGENGSGKSGYTRIAKRLCRSLETDELRGNIYSEFEGPKREIVKYCVGDEDLTTIEWDPSTPPPPVLRQVSVFDSHNARLYVDRGNKIAYLPTELAILEHHGEVCKRIEGMLRQRIKELTERVRAALPAGYTPDSDVSIMLRKLNPKASVLPTEAQLESLSKLSDKEQETLSTLERELSSDPVAMADVRRRAIPLLERANQRFEECLAAYSDEVEQRLGKARIELQDASNAARLAAKMQFTGEVLPNVGEHVWRIMFDAAREFVTNGHEPITERLPEHVGDHCMLCQEPLSIAGSARIKRFNDFVAGEASKRADLARKALDEVVSSIEAAKLPQADTVRDALVEYSKDTVERKEIVKKIAAALDALAQRRASLLSTEISLTQQPDLSHLIQSISTELSALAEEAAEFEKQALHSEVLDKKRKQLANLKDRTKLANDWETVLQRQRDLSLIKEREACLTLVASLPIATQITALRKKLVTAELQDRIAREIKALDLTHLPLEVSDTSSGGQSLFSVGLQSVQKAKSQKILSEGEQRALALACFLAEIGDENVEYGILLDDPVSSLDHKRIRQVAQRLVAEARKGRQVIIFTHNIVFFNEVVGEAEISGSSAPLIKSVVTKTLAEGFGVISEDSEPWIADVRGRMPPLEKRLKELRQFDDRNTDQYRRRVGDFYSDLRETWERAVEELVLAKTVARFDPRVQTGRLRDVEVTDDMYKTIYSAMTKASERSGHDMAAARDIPLPSPDEMTEDLQVLKGFQSTHKAHVTALRKRRKVLEAPEKAILV